MADKISCKKFIFLGFSYSHCELNKEWRKFADGEINDCLEVADEIVCQYKSTRCNITLCTSDFVSKLFRLYRGVSLDPVPVDSMNDPLNEHIKWKFFICSSSFVFTQSLYYL